MAAPRWPGIGWRGSGTVGMRIITRCSMVTWASWMRTGDAGAVATPGAVEAPDAAMSNNDAKIGDAKSSKTFIPLG